MSTAILKTSQESFRISSNTQMTAGVQPIHYAAANGCIKILKMLIEEFAIDPTTEVNMFSSTITSQSAM